MFLVTGYGSIGSLVVQRLVNDGESVLIVDKDEKAIHQALINFKNNLSVQSLVADISSKEDVTRIFLQYNIDKVIHTAAMKHVTFCEQNPILATTNNILGINNLLEAAHQANVKKFINVSTDKSAYPSNVMGATKFIAERTVTLYNEFCEDSYRYQNVRLGNVLFSNGSLLPTIKDIVWNNKTLDLTDLSATRFFIRPDEISEFIVNIAQSHHNGEIIIKKLKSATLEVMVQATLTFLNRDNYKNVKVMGLRQGEKLHEHLYTSTENTHIVDHGDYWAICNQVSNEPLSIIDSSQFCISEEEFLEIIKDLHAKNLTPWKSVW